MILELGCGGRLPEGHTGIDIVGPPSTQAEYICNLGFERLPFMDSYVDECHAHHFIEHVPMAVWFVHPTAGWQRHMSMIFLFNEIYRVLKHDGTLTITVPTVTHTMLPGSVNQQAFQDPTHVSFWVPETIRYFSGDYYGFHDTYSHTSRFELVDLDLSNGWYIIFKIRAIKDLPADAPYELNYKVVKDEN